jgi:peptide/nickel transport system permease protein
VDAEDVTVEGPLAGPSISTVLAEPPAGANVGRRGAIGWLVLRRFAFAVPVLLVVSFGMFALAKLSPFDPVQRYFGVRIIGASAERVAQIRANWGVDDPVLTQYLRWLGNAVTGDLGDSLFLHQPVTQVIAERLPWSVLLASTGFAIATVLGLALGTLAAWRQGGWLDRVITGSSYTLEAAPVFWLGLLALYVFALTLRWLPGGGLTDADAAISVGQVATHLVLPATVLGISQAPWFVLFVRQTVLESLSQDYITGARARGLSERRVLIRHALRTSLLAGCTLLLTGIVLMGNLLADVLYTIADPRVALDG